MVRPFVAFQTCGFEAEGNTIASKDSPSSARRNSLELCLSGGLCKEILSCQKPSACLPDVAEVRDLRTSPQRNAFDFPVCFGKERVSRFIYNYRYRYLDLP